MELEPALPTLLELVTLKNVPNAVGDTFCVEPVSLRCERLEFISTHEDILLADVEPLPGGV